MSKSSRRGHFTRLPGWYLLAGFVAIGMAGCSDPTPNPSGLATYEPSPTIDQLDGTIGAEPSENAYIRPTKAPNGSDWPSTAAYIHGYPLARSNGLSKLTIDNNSNSSDMFVKLVALDADKTLPIRHTLVPAHQSFTINKIRAGRYDVRYMDLSDGSLVRSEEFSLQEISEVGGTRYSATTMTLYKIANGNMQTYPLNPNEF